MLKKVFVGYSEPEPAAEIRFVRIPAGGGCAEFWMSESPITEAQWKAVMGEEVETGSDFPKVNVNLLDAMTFAEKIDCRLPTELEWCWAVGREPENLEEFAVFDKDELQPVKTLRPNEHGLYDMRGLVWEWLDTGDKTVGLLRGGSWFFTQMLARAVFRDINHAANRYSSTGFRVVVARPSSE